MKKFNLVFIAIIAITFNSCNEKYPDLEDGIYAEIITNKGTAIAELYYKETPLTVANFVSLAEGTNTMVDDQYKGKKFYNGIIFHRIIKDFMIQTGDPLGTGAGDPGYKFPDEFSDSLSHKSKGILSMANSGPATNGSQFFITLKPTPWLNGKHTVFGEVINGLEVVDSIGAAKTEKPGDKPADTIKMQEVNIIRKGADAKAFDTKVAFEEKLKVLEKEKLEAEALEKERQAKIALKFPAVAAAHAALRKKAVKLESGLEIHFIKQGDGAKPKPTDIVMINYAGHFADGKIFDTNKIALAKEYGVFDERRAAHPKGYAPMEMKYSPDAQMIPGFKEGVQEMKIGDKAVLFIPPHLGYGDKERGPIPANSELVFDIELVGIAEAPEVQEAPEEKK